MSQPPTPSTAPRPSVPPAGDDAMRVKQLQALLGQTKQAVAQKESELRAAIAQRDLLRTQLSEREARIRELDSAGSGHVELRARIAELEKQLAEGADLRERASALALRAREAESLRERIAELEKDTGDAAALRARISDLEGHASTKDRRISELEAALARQSARIEASSPEVDLGWEAAPPDEDDLRRIKGVGPATERSLRKLGVRSFAQIAAWSDADIARFSSMLKTKRDKVEAWVKRAVELAAKSG